MKVSLLSLFSIVRSAAPGGRTTGKGLIRKICNNSCIPFAFVVLAVASTAFAGGPQGLGSSHSSGMSSRSFSGLGRSSGMGNSGFNHSSLSHGLNLGGGNSSRIMSSPSFTPKFTQTPNLTPRFTQTPKFTQNGNSNLGGLNLNTTKKIDPRFSQNGNSNLGGLNLNVTKKIDPRFSTTPRNIKIDNPILNSNGVKNLVGRNGGINLNQGINLSNTKNNTLPLNGNLNKSFDHLLNGNVARRLDLGKQLDLSKHGDVARKLDLGKKLELDGGWKNRQVGLVNKNYTKQAFGAKYCGPKHCPHFCWFPHWSPWVNWCCGNYGPCWDPRPIWCQPCCYHPCGSWVYWQYPIWQPLPIVSCGTWVDVPLVSTPSADLQLMAVRFVDAGHPEQNLGPRYRVWVRNNGLVALNVPFNVHIMAANSAEPASGMPMSGLRVTAMQPGQTQALDIRLPISANTVGRDAQGRPAPFANLHVLVDSDREIAEAAETNNGVNVDRADILPVDPSLMTASEKSAEVGTTINLAGEGLGPEAGQVLVNVNGLELQAEIEGWYDLGVRVKLPMLALASPVDAKIVIVRGDKAATNPLEIKLTPSTTTASAVSEARE